LRNCLAVDKETFVVNKFTREGVGQTELGENLGGLGYDIYFFFSRWLEFVCMFYETYSVYNTYINIWGEGEGRGRGRGRGGGGGGGGEGEGER
jgi:hypothetical protein